MQNDASGSGPAGSDGSGGNGTPGIPDVNTGPEPVTAKPRTRVRAGVFVAAAVIFTGVGFGATLVIRDQLAPASASSAIPAPPAHNQKFVEDDEGTGADSEANIVQSTVPGLVRIASARGSGTGVVLTPSGLALTSAQVAAGRGTVTARELPSGHACAARIVGSDAARDLTLLQLGCAGAFQPVALGNSRDVAAGDGTVAVSASASGRSFTPATGSVSGTSAATAIAGHRLTGLLQATAQVIPGQGIGGPLVNLSGQVIGITLAGSPGGARETSFAMPINEALTIARQLKH
jgi:S1-C subfamily serine protease